MADVADMASELLIGASISAALRLKRHPKQVFNCNDFKNLSYQSNQTHQKVQGIFLAMTMCRWIGAAQPHIVRSSHYLAPNRKLSALERTYHHQ